MSASTSSKHLGGNTAAGSSVAPPSTSSGLELDQSNIYQDGDLGAVDSSPYLGFDFDADGDENFDFDEDSQLIGDLPNDSSTLEDGHLHDKRKELGDQSTENGGGKRREGEPKVPKKPGRKPLTAEPVTVSQTACFIFSLTRSRNERRRTGLRSEHFESARKNC